MKSTAKFMVCIMAIVLVLKNSSTAQSVQENSQVTPAALDSYFRFYVEDQYAKNGGLFMMLKEENSEKGIKCRFTQTFVNKTKQVSESKFILPVEFIDENNKKYLVDVHISGTTGKDLNATSLILKGPVKE